MSESTELHFMECDGEDPCSCDREAVALALAAWIEEENDEDLSRWWNEGGA